MMLLTGSFLIKLTQRVFRGYMESFNSIVLTRIRNGEDGFYPHQLMKLSHQIRSVLGLSLAISFEVNWVSRSDKVS